MSIQGVLIVMKSQTTRTITMARQSKAPRIQQNTTVHTVRKLGSPLEIRYGWSGECGPIPDADYPTQHALNDHIAIMWKRHENKYRRRFAKSQLVETQFHIMDRDPVTEERGLFFVLTTHFYEPQPEPVAEKEPAPVKAVKPAKAPAKVATKKPVPRTPGLVNSHVKRAVAKRLNCTTRQLNKFTSLEALSEDDMLEIAASLRETFGINIAPSTAKKWRKGSLFVIESAVAGAKEKRS